MGPNFLKSRLYQNLELVKTLVRPGSLFHQDLSKEKTLSDEGYGSVTRVFFCDKDQAMNIKLKRWMINNNPLKAVLEIKGAEHMPMFSKTKQLCNVLMREKEFEIEGLKRRKREKRNQRN
ncbi:methylesterase 1-like [Gossypium hirsutum]|uniref:Methylesterase 1-like n=1 Tax=Gossypium hirsutum TaxID=3635 RepID=A0A1U8KWW7_GOSHI|nr:methylesterase 1-like [Gossypium hirsutum]